MKALNFLIIGLLMSLLATSAVADDGHVLRHVVSFKYKETASEADIKKVTDAFVELKTKIPTIQKLEWGVNNSKEGHNKGCTHAFILTFKSEKDRDDYIVHPAHKAFGGVVGPVLADVFVIDFWAHE